MLCVHAVQCTLMHGWNLLQVEIINSARSCLFASDSSILRLQKQNICPKLTCFVVHVWFIKITALICFDYLLFFLPVSWTCLACQICMKRYDRNNKIHKTKTKENKTKLHLKSLLPIGHQAWKIFCFYKISCFCLWPDLHGFYSILCLFQDFSKISCFYC